MSSKARELLLKIHKTVGQINTPPPTTFSPFTGQVEKERQYNANTGIQYNPNLTYNDRRD